jgi:hypothetical protein
VEKKPEQQKTEPKAPVAAQKVEAKPTEKKAEESKPVEKKSADDFDKKTAKKPKTKA